jgi:hypothetical protein
LKFLSFLSQLPFISPVRNNIQFVGFVGGVGGTLFIY